LEIAVFEDAEAEGETEQGQARRDGEGAEPALVGVGEGDELERDDGNVEEDEGGTGENAAPGLFRR
jgi:hypothetical protein